MKLLANLLPDLNSLPDRDFEHEQRSLDARDIRDRLPAFYRHAGPLELAARVSVDRVLTAARAWQPGSGNAIFLGPTGIGKSTAAAYLFRRLLAVGVRDGGDAWEFASRIQWFSASELARARREHPLGQGDAPEVGAACRASLLVIDDLGWERDVGAVADILAHRYEQVAPTVATSGKTGDELSAQYGAAVIRRLCEVGGPQRATVVDCFEVPSG